MNFKLQPIFRRANNRAAGVPGSLVKHGVCLLAAFCFASVAFGSPSFSLHGSSILSDFDGDHQADLATAEPAVSVAGASRYRVEVFLSGAPSGSFYVDSPALKGLRITARDVDGDDDLDLVITSKFYELIGVWLNNGRGQFTRDAAWARLPQSGSVHSVDAPDTPPKPLIWASAFNGFLNPPHPAICFDLESCSRSDFDGIARSARLNPGSSLRAPPRC